MNALFTRLAFQQSGTLIEQLDVNLVQLGMAKGLIAVNEFGKTNAPGLYAGGDNSGMRSTSMAMGNGNKAWMALNRELIEEEIKAS